MISKRLLLTFVIALVARLSLVFIAYHGDLNNNISWGTLAVERGLAGFYEGKVWVYSAPNQPPLTILLFAALRLIWQGVENLSWWLNNQVSLFPSPFVWFWEEKGMILLVKLPSVLADLGIAWAIYNFLKKQNERMATIASTIWLFNPVSWYNSSVWGQTDSVVNFLGLLATISLLERRLSLFAIFFSASFFFKGSLGIFAPILFFVATLQKHSISEWCKAILGSIVSIVFISIWFHPGLDLAFWLINLYKTRILSGEIGFLTANAFNLWWLVDPGRTLDSTLYFGLPAKTWGFLIVVPGMIWLILWLAKNVTDKKVFYSLATISLLSFLFLTRIHERYMYPFFPYTTLLLGSMPVLAGIYSIFSVTYILNLYHLFWEPPISLLKNLYISNVFQGLLSLVNLLSFIWFLRASKKFKS